MMVGVFFFLCTFLVAICILEFKYYNRLLHGTVYAIIELEELSEEK